MDIEKPSLNQPAEADAKSQEQQPKQDEAAVTNDFTFYNVMPQVKSDGQIVQPVMKAGETSSPLPNNAEKPSVLELLKKYKIYAIGVLALLIGGPLVYFLVQKLGASAYPQENFLVSHTSTSTPAASNSNNVAEPDGVTTSPDWQKKYFGNEICQDVNICGDNADPDHDGLTNLEEFKLGTDPNNPDSDGDGLADGDEVHVFLTNPLDAHTAKDPKYSDSDYVIGAYDVTSGQKMSGDQIKAVSGLMQKYGLHQPTLKTLLNVLNSIYNFDASTATSTSSTTITTLPVASSSTSTLTTLDQSPEAKQDRDAQRTNTIKTLGIALVKYYDDNKTFPTANTVQDAYQAVRVYVKVALNPVDPINKDPYLYNYSVSSDGNDFTLSFYSETLNQIIKKHAADSRTDMLQEQGATYDNQREMDLESLRSALLLYSNDNVAGNQTYVFPTVDKYKTALVPKYLSSVPKDPKTGQDYSYTVSQTFDTFTLKAPLDNPPTGTTGYMCNQDECRNY